MKPRIAKAIQRIKGLGGDFEIHPPNWQCIQPTRFETLYGREGLHLMRHLQTKPLPLHFAADGRVFQYRIP